MDYVVSILFQLCKSIKNQELFLLEIMSFLIPTQINLGIQNAN